MIEYRFLSHAKINWRLHIGSLRSDGYHNIITVMQKISLGDEVRVVFPALEDVVTCSESIPTDKNSPLMKVLHLIREIKPSLKRFCFEIQILKRIPQQSGLGGASSNAGTLLRALNKLLKLGLDEKELVKIAIQLGSDVPFFASDYVFALVRGKGEVVVPIPDPPQRELVLVCPSFGISTAWAYQAWDLKVGASQGFREKDERNKVLVVESEDSLLRDVHNDFEEVVFAHYPELFSYKRKLYQAGCEKAFLSGSGSTLVGVLPQENHRTKNMVVELFRDEPVRVVFCKTLCQEPALPAFCRGRV
ncbi:4-(cytidine 5'-diphospho)-2-C-methyl-D-erythritol kinase [Thermatribacter velox]|uniref:4-diphosphocytidyl-2-C-methyl-D-erythritol kinase n=1 Tax=Thermatribacter velox TaxID=3039681 RepID=A0ABZ2YDB7_9BACT